MVTFLTMAQFTFMATNQGSGGEIQVRLTNLVFCGLPTYLPTYPADIVTYGLPTYLRVLIGHLPIYPKATYGLPTSVPMGHLGTTQGAIQGLPRGHIRAITQGLPKLPDTQGLLVALFKGLFWGYLEDYFEGYVELFCEHLNGYLRSILEIALVWRELKNSSRVSQGVILRLHRGFLGATQRLPKDIFWVYLWDYIVGGLFRVHLGYCLQVTQGAILKAVLWPF